MKTRAKKTNTISPKNTQLTRIYGETRGEIENRLLIRNPSWNPETVYNWTDAQLLQIYKREHAKAVQETLAALG